MSFNFAAPATTTSGFNFSASPAVPTFGATAASPQQNNATFITNQPSNMLSGGLASVGFGGVQQQQQQQQQPTASFGQTGTPSFGGLSQQAAAVPGAFGTTATMPQFSIGTSQPGSNSFGLGGASVATTAPPAFGAQTSTPLLSTPTAAALGSFGAVTATPTQSLGGLPTFGASTIGGGIGTTAPTISFGTPLQSKPISTIQPLGFSGGAAITPTQATTLPTFGQATAMVQPTLGLGGGAPAMSLPAATTATATPGFNFSATPTAGAAAVAAPSATPAATGLNFGLTPLAGNLNFGSGTTASPLTATTTGAATNLPGFSGFGNISTTSTTTAANVAAAPTLGLFGAKTTTPGAIGTAATTTTATGSALPSLFGNTTAAGAAVGGGGVGLFGTTSVAPALATSSLLQTPLTGAAQPAAIKIGLGGVDNNASQPKTVEGRSESVRVKELPAEIVVTVDALKSHIKQQKQFSSDIARTSTHKLFSVSNDLQSLNYSLAEISNCVETNFAAIKLLRHETGGAIRQAEMAQRTQEIQPCLQFENSAPLQYFMELVQKFETDMITFRTQVELNEKHMRSLANPQPFTADDLKKGLQQIHESFIALAGRLHDTHQKVEAQKEQYLNLRKHLLKDKTNIFEDDQLTEKSQSLANISCGPTPFSTTFGINFSLSNSNAGGGGAGRHQQLLLQQQQQPQQQQQQQQNSLGMAATNSSFGFGNTLGSNINFGLNNPVAAPISTNLLGFSTSSADGTFKLQQPPIGTKRNKQ